MKNIHKISIVAILLVIIVNACGMAQKQPSNITTSTFKVYGNCDQCKARIEKAAKVDGVSKAEWNKDTKVLTLVYDPTQVKSDDVLKNIAAAGHDTEKFKADNKAYDKLPGCCKYR